jgi:hypothetical protein
MHHETNFKRLLSAALLTGALGLMASGQVKTSTTTATSPTGTSSAPVTVLNTTANPVPVAGTVNVGNTVPVAGSVNVANTTANPVPIAGTVNVSGTANVSISDNSADHPLQVRDVDHGLRTPYAQTKRFAFDPRERVILGNLDVPAGKRLVIESFSVFGKLPSGNKLVEVSINAFQGGEQFGTQEFAPVFTGSTEETFEPGVFIVSSGPMHLDAVAGTGTITVHLERDHITPLLIPFPFDVNITGYLVDEK